ncbi:hypothetical protein HanRHA438_Chr04g0161541 [Helianthus annuus]|nr:hypothetical protein HanHA300_Chr04g0124751 [Helianthus annuus]KAJ0595961.1 hypothetical protein HanHA89_Chr04g0137281 [Helianthus annuus]KAJ0925603.1 hypothetical protein HanRHA438_Chr04g0161541 [Helianthus annuus]
MDVWKEWCSQITTSWFCSSIIHRFYSSINHQKVVTVRLQICSFVFLVLFHCFLLKIFKTDNDVELYKHMT